MARRIFFSFNFHEDHWRASQVRNIGAIEGNSELSDNDWEAVKKKGDASIANWIDDQMHGRSCVVVLVGSATAGRKWIDYEIRKGWELGKGLVGIRIHRLLNRQSQSSFAGSNPFQKFSVGPNSLASIVKLYDPPGFDSKQVYASISSNIGQLVDDAIVTRAKY